MCATLQAADPAQALTAHWADLGDVTHYAHCWLVGAGKASIALAQTAAGFLGERLSDGAIAAIPELVGPTDRYQVFAASHPLPDERNLRAARAIADVATQASRGDLLICLISGGGSAHLTLPVEGLTLDDLRRVTARLLHAGAPIQDLNTVRKHCEQLKGGGLARLASPAEIVTFVLSDVVGDHLDVIASGPTAPDPTTYQDALDTLAHYDALDISRAVTQHLKAGVQDEHPETLKPGDPLLERVCHVIIGNNAVAIQAAAARAKELGFAVQVANTPATGEARQVGTELAKIAKKLPRPGCYIVGGETTVTVHGGGIGGRNQEVALSSALSLDGTPDIVVAAFATDGVDGPTDAAGAIVTGETCSQARAVGLEPQTYLDNNDSYAFFRAMDTLLSTGPTGTNVNDLAFALAY